jgi:hypothetical protein
LAPTRVSDQTIAVVIRRKNFEFPLLQNISK